MTADQTAILLILGAALVLFIWDRLRYDIVALLALLASVFAGLVPADEAFSGFSDPVVVTVAAVLVISAAIRNSGLLELMARPMEPLLRTPTVQVLVLSGAVALFSAFMNNVGALAIFLPLAIQVANRTGRPPSLLLMPLAFGSLLGGLITLIGTPPNILISGVRRDIVGTGFSMFDFAPVGIPLTLAGVLFLTVGWRLLPRDRQGQATPETLFRIEDYTTEALLPEDSPYVGRTVAEIEKQGDGEIAVTAIIREQFRRFVPTGEWTLHAGDVLMLEGDPHAVKRVMDAAGLTLSEAPPDDRPAAPEDELGLVEAVVMNGSPLAGQSLADIRLRDRFGISLLAVGRRGERITVRLRRVKLQPGDVVVLQGRLSTMPEKLAVLGCLPLAQRNVRLGQPSRVLAAAVVFGLAVAAAVLELVPISIAFLAAVAAIAILKLLTLKEIYDSIAWPVLVLIGALIPVSQALQDTGATDVIAGVLQHVASAMPAAGALALVLVATMLVTPVLNNAATVLVMGPIAASLALRLGLSVDPFLMAVAVGASSDFLTPIGHQSNTLVMGPGGYRFGDYWRLGLPLSILVVLLGVPVIMWAWPLT